MTGEEDDSAPGGGEMAAGAADTGPRAEDLSDELARKWDPERLLGMVSKRAGRGQQLDATLRNRYERKFGVDLSHVRIIHRRVRRGVQQAAQRQRGDGRLDRHDPHGRPRRQGDAHRRGRRAPRPRAGPRRPGPARPVPPGPDGRGTPLATEEAEEEAEAAEHAELAEHQGGASRPPRRGGRGQERRRTWSRRSRPRSRRCSARPAGSGGCATGWIRAVRDGRRAARERGILRPR